MRNGADEQLSTGAATYTEMMLQAALDYPGLPDPRTLTTAQIVFFYNGLRKQLKEHTRGQ